MQSGKFAWQNSVFSIRERQVECCSGVGVWPGGGTFSWYLSGKRLDSGALMAKNGGFVAHSVRVSTRSATARRQRHQPVLRALVKRCNGSGATNVRTLSPPRASVMGSDLSSPRERLAKRSQAMWRATAHIATWHGCCRGVSTMSYRAPPSTDGSPQQERPPRLRLRYLENSLRHCGVDGSALTANISTSPTVTLQF